MQMSTERLEAALRQACEAQADELAALQCRGVPRHSSRQVNRLADAINALHGCLHIAMASTEQTRPKMSLSMLQHALQQARAACDVEVLAMLRGGQDGADERQLPRLTHMVNALQICVRDAVFKSGAYGRRAIESEEQNEWSLVQRLIEASQLRDNRPASIRAQSACDFVAADGAARPQKDVGATKMFDSSARTP